MSDTLKALQGLKRRFGRERAELQTRCDAEDLAGMHLEAASSDRAARQWDVAMEMVDAEIRKAKQ